MEIPLNQNFESNSRQTEKNKANTTRVISLNHEGAFVDNKRAIGVHREFVVMDFDRKFLDEFREMYGQVVLAATLKIAERPVPLYRRLFNWLR